MQVKPCPAQPFGFKEKYNEKIMALKNTYTKMPINRIIEKLQSVLLDAGASKIMFDYSGDRLPYQISFILDYNGQSIPFKLPARVDKVYSYMCKERIRTTPDMDMAYKVAWRNILDWIDAQMALVKIEQVELVEVFMPYITVQGGLTYFESERNNILKLN